MAEVDAILYGDLSRLPKAGTEDFRMHWVKTLDPDQLFLAEAFEDQWGGFSGGDVNWLVASSRLLTSWFRQAQKIGGADKHVLEVQRDYLTTLKQDLHLSDHACISRYAHQIADKDLLEVVPLSGDGKKIRTQHQLYANRHQLQAIEILRGLHGNWSFYHHVSSHADDCSYTELIYRIQGQLAGSVSVGVEDDVRNK